MDAIIILDLQKGILKKKDFSIVLNNIKKLIFEFKKNNNIVILTKHISNDTDSPYYIESSDVDIPEEILGFGDYVIEKTSCNPFYRTNLSRILTDNDVSKVYICGFNTEYCCLFSSILCADRGYKTFFIEDASGTFGDEFIYEMPGIDINDFIGSILNWSGEVHVLYTHEFLDGF
ncbi:isochorismatase family protein [Lagierella sp.]|uniref:isochorismatase family protein n=1 Tax=Lagierella sp. TaxID=2849657 RepID=UPI002636822B|nr:isochorismatase family protein [Lagierella sp.]